MNVRTVPATPNLSTMYHLLAFFGLVALSSGATLDFPSARHHILGNIYPNGRIVGGVQTDISRVPYQLALERNGRQFCGASILSASVALTASHCVDKLSTSGVTVRTGSSKRQSGGASHKVSKILMFPKYNRQNNDYDVAILFLETPIKFSGNSKAISIASSEPTSGRVLLSGWGDLKEGANSGSPNLMSVEVNIVPRTTCAKKYSSTTTITARMFCAGAPGKDSCQGDSGGPAVVGGQLAGVVSWGIGCARPDYPGVYANLANSEIRQWIKTNANV